MVHAESSMVAQEAMCAAETALRPVRMAIAYRREAWTGSRLAQSPNSKNGKLLRVISASAKMSLKS